jgi:cbb3-type cytochrome oxidase subunit 3
MKQYRQYHGSNISFIDMLFNILLAFVLLFFAVVLFINPPAKKKDIEAKADIIITMSWPDMSPHDIDLWVRPPDGNNIGFTHKENSYLFLERDDLGISNNFVIKDGQKISLSPRREVVTFRGVMPGRYVVNTHFYMAKTTNGISGTFDGVPVPVVVELIQINPSYKILTRKEIILENPKEEKTAFSFIIRDDLVTDIDTETEEHFILNPKGPTDPTSPTGEPHR